MYESGVMHIPLGSTGEGILNFLGCSGRWFGWGGLLPSESHPDKVAMVHAAMVLNGVKCKCPDFFNIYKCGYKLHEEN